MKYYIIAGEASGDLHASNLIKELRILDNQAEFRVWGGEMMKAQGTELVKHYKDLAFMGFVEVVFNIRTILKNIRFCKKDIINYQPDVVILVDYPGFNLRIAEFAHNNKFKVVYYISPTVWAWNPSRIEKVRKFVDKMLVILPFEKEFYKKHNLDVEFVGHPLLDSIDYNVNNHKKEFLLKNELADNSALIALLPGSRKQEISRMLPLMLSISSEFPDKTFLVAATNSIDLEFYKSCIGNRKAKIIQNQTHEILKFSEAGLVTSGTATLEAALFKLPQVVCYKANHISFQIAKMLVKLKFISLVNLIMEREVVAELIQENLTTQKLKRELDSLVEGGDKRTQVLTSYDELIKKLGGKGASLKAAQIIVNCIKK